MECVGCDSDGMNCLWFKPKVVVGWLGWSISVEVIAADGVEHSCSTCWTCVCVCMLCVWHQEALIFSESWPQFVFSLCAHCRFDNVIITSTHRQLRCWWAGCHSVCLIWTCTVSLATGTQRMLWSSADGGCLHPGSVCQQWVSSSTSMSLHPASRLQVSVTPPSTALTGYTTLPPSTALSGYIIRPPSTALTGYTICPPSTALSGYTTLPPSTALTGYTICPPSTALTGHNTLPPSTALTDYTTAPPSTALTGYTTLHPASALTGYTTLPPSLHCPNWYETSSILHLLP